MYGFCRTVLSSTCLFCDVCVCVCVCVSQDRLLRSILPQRLTTTMADEIIESRKRGNSEKKHSEFRDLRIQAADNVR